MLKLKFYLMMTLKKTKLINILTNLKLRLEDKQSGRLKIKSHRSSREMFKKQ